MLISEKETNSIKCCGPEGCGDLTDSLNRRCVGSNCMAWSWFDPVTIEMHCSSRGKFTKEEMTSFGPASNWPSAMLSGSWRLVETGNRRRGFCNYAGVPLGHIEPFSLPKNY